MPPYSVYSANLNQQRHPAIVLPEATVAQASGF